MIDSFPCLTQTYDLWLVLVAALVCGAGSFATFSLLPRIAAERGSRGAIVWVALATVTAAAGIWSTHVIAMMAFHPDVGAMGFDRATTALSLLVAMAMVSVSLSIVASTPGRLGQVAGGIGLGTATVFMHYTGVSGLMVGGHIEWASSLVLLSAGLSVGLAVAALLACGDGMRRPRRAAGAMLFGVSILTLHATGMAAMAIRPDRTVALPHNLLSGNLLAVSVAAGSLLVIAAAVAAVMIDLRARRESDVHFRFLARHDLLTRLPNRLHFEERAAKILAGSAADGRAAAIFCLGLDGFKDVNDIFGHAAGDQVLVIVAARLRAILGERCIAARLGGDQFAILAAELDGVRTAAVAAQVVIDAFADPVAVQGALLNIGCSIGVAHFPSDGETLPQLLARADLALSTAKRNGSGQIRFFDMAMDDALRERAALGTDLRMALAAGELSLHFQPQLAIATHAVGGFEALLRWHHPVRGTIAPARFIPIAEETGLILPIGDWVLRAACLEAASWAQPLRIAVNLSVAQFREPHLPDTIRAILAESGLPPQRLEIEITESLLLESTPRTLQTLQAIRALGVRIGMDDFGTGFSSLSTLASFDFDTIKIDRSFTAQIGHRAKTTAIVKAIVALGHSLEIEIVAEGVETIEQHALLREIGCDTIQGYLFGRPKPIDDYIDLIRPRAAAVEDPAVVVLRVA